MDQDDYDESNESSTENSSGKGLRAQLEKALEDKKALESQLSESKSKIRQSEVSSVLAAKGVNSKIAKFIPADVEGEEAIAKWLDENADVFGVSSQPQEQTPASEQSSVPQEVKESAQRMQSLGNSTESPSKLTDIQERMRNAQTAEELQELWAEAQKFLL